MTESCPDAHGPRNAAAYDTKSRLIPVACDRLELPYMVSTEGKPLGAVVMLHGLTDSPYSLRHLSRMYRDAGLRGSSRRACRPRLRVRRACRASSGAGAAATRLAVREARRLAPRRRRCT